MKKRALYIFIISILSFGNCANQAPFTGTFAYDPGAAITPGATYDASTGCYTDADQLNSKITLIKIGPESMVQEQIKYTGPNCVNRTEVMRQTYRHKYGNNFEAPTVETNYLSQATETGVTVYAQMVDYMINKREIYCDTSDCAAMATMTLAASIISTGDPYGYCNITINPSQWVDLTNCHFWTGTLDNSIIYDSQYYDFLNFTSGQAQLYVGADYSSVGNIVDWSSPATRPDYIEVGSWYNQISSSY